MEVPRAIMQTDFRERTNSSRYKYEQNIARFYVKKSIVTLEGSISHTRSA